MTELEQLIKDKGHLIVESLVVIQREISVKNLEEAAEALDANSRFLGITDVVEEDGKYSWKMGPLFVNSYLGHSK